MGNEESLLKRVRNGADKSPRVLFISPQPFFEWRGSPIRVKFNTLALSELGYEVDLLTLPIGKSDPTVSARVIRAWNLFRSKRISIGPSGLKLWFDLLLLIKGMQLIILNKYDVLHGTEEAGFLCYLLSRFCRAKCIYEKHSDTDSYKNKKGTLKNLLLDIYHGVERFTIRHSNLTIATGPGLKEQALSAAPSASVQTIPDIPSSIVEPSQDTVQEIRDTLEIGTDQVIVTYVGSFAIYQGVDIIFDAIPSVIKQNTKIKFAIIGGNPREIDHYQALLKSKSITDQVTFLGKIDPDKLPAYLAASDILLAPRKSGINSPLKILDYFKAGRAIVATNTVANQRLLNSSNSELCEFSATSFANSILNLAKNPERRKQLGENGYKAYREKYNFLKFKQQLQMTYQTVLEN